MLNNKTPSASVSRFYFSSREIGECPMCARIQLQMLVTNYILLQNAGGKKSLLVSHDFPVKT